MNHLFVTQDFGPDKGGMARRHVELARRFADASNEMSVSTVRVEGHEEFDRGEKYSIDRQPFHFREANRFYNQVRWARWLTGTRHPPIDVIHCGNIRPAGYAVDWAHRRLHVPYIVYVNGGDLLREKKKTASSALKRATARRILGQASGIAATSTWVADLTRDVMEQVGVKNIPPIAPLDLGTDSATFAPSRDTGRLRQNWNLAATDKLMITVARLVPHKGQDTAIRALALLARDFPSLHYVLVGEGGDEERLRSLASSLGVSGKVIFAGALRDADLPEAYATSTIYVGPSRVDNEVNVEGFGISFLEASSSGLPIVAGNSGGVRSAVRVGVTGVVVSPLDVEGFAAEIAGFLGDDEKRAAFGAAGRNAVLTHYNWDRVARETREFTLSVIGTKR